MKKLIAFSAIRHDPELACLRELSVRIGSDPLLVQASNGNASLKLDGILWIKASGKWLARANQDDMFVPVELAEVREAIEHGKDIAQCRVLKNEMRPSVETVMHSLLPQRVVIHVHSINTIAWAIRVDGPEQLKPRLDGLRWQWIPYVASGIPLAREIEKAVARAKETDVFVLGNHGLVVCGDNCVTAEKLLCEVERRLAVIRRSYPTPDTALLGMIAHLPRWQLPDFDPLHALATDLVSLRILRGGALYPCQAIFLGQAMPVVPATLAVSKLRECLSGNDGPFVVVESRGMLLNGKITTVQRATLIGLMEVIQRTEESAPLRYLNRKEVKRVLNAGAYGYKDGVIEGLRESSNNLTVNVQ